MPPQIAQLWQRFAEPVLVIASGIGIWSILVYLDAFEAAVAFAKAHETFELDEAFLAISIIGILGFLYSIRHHARLKGELRRRVEAERRAAWLAEHDVLTGLANRRQLAQFIHDIDSQSANAQPRLAVFSIDLDGFKNLNDLLGHAAGDDLLIGMALRLTTAFPQETVVRLGGDEFLVIADRARFDDPAATAGTLHAAITEPMTLQEGGSEIGLGVSIGVSLYPDHAETLRETIRKADMAMYAAKHGQDQPVRLFDAKLEASMREQKEIEEHFLIALDADEIYLDYQPVFDTQRNGVVSLEALARWTSPKHGPIGPDIFVKLAEGLGRIRVMTDRLLRRACHDALSWPTAARLSFNLSPAELADRHCASRILNTLSQAEFPPTRLEIELTETSVFETNEDAVRILTALRDAGVAIVIDDFGAGYANFSRLSALSFDSFKISPRLIQQLDHDPRCREIVRTILDLANRLGVRAIAEGVETERQREILRSLGCTLVQGNIFSPPVAALAAPELLRAFPQV
jgi:diguanylate cyclase (GGDEF)-like protein